MTLLALLLSRHTSADRAAEALFSVAARGARAFRSAAPDAAVAVRSWAASLVDPSCPSPAIAAELAAAMGGAARVRGPAGDLGRALGRGTRALVDDVAASFERHWERPDQAHMAAGVFVAAVALAGAGVLGAVTVALPPPTAELQHLARVVNRVTVSDTEPAAAAAASPPAAAGGSSPDATATAAPAAAAPAPAAPEDPMVAAPVSAPATVDVPATAVPPATRGALPIGKGMWIWMEERADGGDPDAIVARARATGLTHLYVRTGTLKGGFVAGPFLDRLLPVAHANGIRVYGWDFPYLDRPGDDVNRALAAIRYTTADGHRIDGFTADIESPSEGTNNSLENVTAYCTWLRQNVGAGYPLIATVPNPTPKKLRTGFPYQAIIPSFDAVAPMVYWMNRDPAADVAHAVTFLSQFGKPVFPIGQAYDGGGEGGPPGVPSREAIIRFLQYADAAGGAGVSFWSYQHASPEAWDAVRDSAEFRLDVGGPNAEGLTPGMVRAYQTGLTAAGFPVATDGSWGPGTIGALRAYQAAAKLPLTGRVDAATRAFLLTPVAAPIVPD